MKLRFFLNVLALLIILPLNAQIQWSPGNPDLQNRNINTLKSDVYDTDFAILKTYLEAAPHERHAGFREGAYSLNIPIDGQEVSFLILQTDVMHPDLARNYPNIKTFIGKQVNGNGYARFDFTNKGFHAWIKFQGKTIFIDPQVPGELNTYMVYDRDSFYKAFNGDPMQCSFEEANQSLLKEDKKVKKDILQFGHNLQKSTGDELRTYRLALACTGEYATFHGGTVTSVMDEFVVAMNRVNGIYETEVAIRMVLVPNNDDLIFLDGTTDPYTNNSGGTMLGQNVSTCNSIIGSANYDIGHVFSTGGGGVAYLNAPCGSNKAGGVTGLGSPVNDPFYVDYVSHEIGHQFGGRHTQNNPCNRSAIAAYEPGSASTIMGYAGICSPNLQSNSDDHFHIHSYDEIIAFSQTANGNTCAAVSSTTNLAPSVSVDPNGFFIPKGTPFKLEGSAIDPDGDPLMYRWEEHDLGPATASGDNNLTNPSGTQPVFRSWPATDDPIRYCPRLEDLVSNTATIGEHLPTYARELSFRLVALDFVPGGGGVDYGEVTFEMADNSGPFKVNSPDGGELVGAGVLTSIAWDVSNSDMAPVNCANVNILLSTDGGYTYPTILLANTPNDGSESVIMPNINTTTARIMVQASGNIFFDISNNDFEISQSVGSTILDLGINTISSPIGSYCNTDVDGVFDIINLGVEEVVSVEYSYQIGNETPIISTWTGSLLTGQVATINIPQLSFTSIGNLDFTVSILDVNGQGLDEISSNDVQSSSFDYYDGENEIEISILTDCWGSEVTWEFTNDNGDLIASGGPYGNQQQFLTPVTCLNDGCYTFEIFDSYGDGLNGSAFGCQIDGDYSITDNFGNVVVQMGDPDYDNGIAHNFCLPFVPSLEASFDMTPLTICQGESVDFTDTSAGNPTSWNWTFDQGIPASSNDQDPSVQFNLPGSYEVSLTVSDGNVFSTATQTLVVLGNSSWYADTDNDGFGDPDNGIADCIQPAGYVANFDDCDDSNPNIFPGAIELCDGVDNNCDGNIDEGVLITYYIDNDDDGFGSAAQTIEACSVPTGYADNSNDCNDDDPAVNPDSPELCDGIDNNCNNEIDEGLVNTYYVDFDNDGFGNPYQSVTSCFLPNGFVTNGDDCDDLNGTVYPGAEEICGDGLDNDCDGFFEEDCGSCFPGSVPAPGGLQNQFAPNGYLLTWDPIPGSVACQVNGGSTFGPQVSINIFQNEPSERFVHISQLTPGVTYQWRVRCACQVNPSVIAGPFSGYNFFSVPVDLQLQNEELKMNALASDLKIYPNPSTGFISVDGLHSDTRINIYNSLGIREHNFDRNEMLLDLNQLADGIYFIQFYNEERIIDTQRLVLTR